VSTDGRALVTGASAGIGRSFAHALAARGDDLVLVARDVARLELLAEELRARHGVEAEVLGADLLADEGIVAVEQRLRDGSDPVDLLVNNAGMGTFGDFVGADMDAVDREIRLNVLALVRLTRAALESMVRRGRGAVLNISSLAGYQPAPSSATYAATKAFVNSFTHSVHEECRRKGVHVMLVCPGYTHTEFHERAGLGPTQIPEFMWQSSEQVVSAALRDLDRRRAVSVPGVLNKTLGAASSVTPAAVTRRIAGMVMRRSG
jgi:short-subunit dehydrogenase